MGGKKVPESKMFDGEEFELLNGNYYKAGKGPSDGYDKETAQKCAQVWRDSYPGSKARVVKIGNYYYAYGM